jgi:type I restriction enzyme M protein
MAKVKKTNGDLNFEAKLWQAADKMRNNMDAAEYKHVVLGLIFLKYISDAFNELYQKLSNTKGADPEDSDEYRAENVFYVPKKARWDYLQKNAKQPTIGKLIDDAMDEIEKDNTGLKGVLPKNYAREGLDKQRLGELIDLIGTIGLGDKENRSKDILGRVYEYFIGRFADAEGKSGGQFYTPRSIVKLLVDMLEPYKGRVFDPCCGSGGMFVQSEKFVQVHGGRIGDIAVYGQESNQTTWRLCKMNLAIRGIDANIAWNNEGSFLNDVHKDLKADFVIANPPFNDSDWKGELLREDIRWKYGTPPTGNANFAWVQHFIYHLSPAGVAGFVLGNISLTSEMGGEDVIRKAIIDADIVDCIVTFPDKLFYSTPIPASIWLIRRARASSVSNKVRKKEILFIDASKLGKNVTRTHSELTDKDISVIAQTYRFWLTRSNNYVDKKGFCRSVSVEEVLNNKCNLLPASYVNAGHIRASHSLKVRDLLMIPDKDITTQALKRVSDLSLSFNDLIKRFGIQDRNLEKLITFKTYTLNDLLERPDERLGD